jgi:site-specific recombinase XerD
VPPEKLQFAHFNRTAIQEFLVWLESEQNCGITTRNQRLAAVRSFFRYVQIEQPDMLMTSQSIINIESKKTAKPVINYLTGDAIKLLLSQPNAHNYDERRDLALLSLLYDSAARVQELCDLTVRSLRLTSPPVVRLTGKGRKTREIPLSAQCSELLRKYVQERNLGNQASLDAPLFSNRQLNKLTRGGVSYILQKYVDRANIGTLGFIPQSVTPHSLRHSKAMHLLEAGVNLIYIRDFLGHEDITTTQVYARANPETKRAAIEKVYSNIQTPHMSDWNSDNNLMSFLKGLTL